MLKLYADLLSQPVRACKITLDMLKLNYEFVNIRIQFDEHRTPEFTKINPRQLLPTLQDGDFILTESHTIMKYLIRSRNITTDLYPADPKKCARVDEYLDYHHTNTRKCMSLYYNVLIAPKKGITTGESVPKLQQEVKTVIEFLDGKLQNSYIAGDKLTLADISAFSELMQLNMIKYDFTPYTNLYEWMLKMNSIQEVKDAHSVAYKIIKKQFPQCPFI